MECDNKCYNLFSYDYSNRDSRSLAPCNGGKKLLAQGYQVGDRLQLYYGIKDGEPYPIPWEGDMTYPIDVKRYITDAKKYVEVIFKALEDSSN